MSWRAWLILVFLQSDALLGPSARPAVFVAQPDVVVALLDVVAERLVSARSLCAQEQAHARALQPEQVSQPVRVWTPCEALRCGRLAVPDASRCAPLASSSHVRAWPPVSQLLGFPRPCFPLLCSPQLYFPRLCSQSPCSQPRDSPRPCCHSPYFQRLCSRSFSFQQPCWLRLYSRSLCSQRFDSRPPYSLSPSSQPPYSLRSYSRWPSSRSHGSPPELRASLPHPCQKTRPAWPLLQPHDARDSPTPTFHGSRRQSVAVLIVLPSLECALHEQRFLA